MALGTLPVCGTAQDPRISAYVPCYNAAATLARVIAAIRAQTLPVDQLLVVDDGSTDATAEVAAGLGCEVIRLARNLGRGAARARAMLEARHELVLCCDGSKVPDSGFTAAAVGWFEDPRVAAVVSGLEQLPARSAAERWRGRHLFARGHVAVSSPSPYFASWGAMVRRSMVLEVGNYDRRLRCNEDGDLGRRLLARDFLIVREPRAVTVEIAASSVHRALERHWRWGSWNRGRGPDLRPGAYLREIADSLRWMVREDLRCGDVGSIPISLVSPHYRYWRSWWERAVRGSGALVVANVLAKARAR